MYYLFYQNPHFPHRLVGKGLFLCIIIYVYYTILLAYNPVGILSSRRFIR